MVGHNANQACGTGHKAWSLAPSPPITIYYYYYYDYDYDKFISIVLLLRQLLISVLLVLVDFVPDPPTAQLPPRPEETPSPTAQLLPPVASPASATLALAQLPRSFICLYHFDRRSDIFLGHELTITIETESLTRNTMKTCSVDIRKKKLLRHCRQQLPPQHRRQQLPPLLRTSAAASAQEDPGASLDRSRVGQVRHCQFQGTNIA